MKLLRNVLRGFYPVVSLAAKWPLCRKRAARKNSPTAEKLLERSHDPFATFIREADLV